MSGHYVFGNGNWCIESVRREYILSSFEKLYIVYQYTGCKYSLECPLYLVHVFWSEIAFTFQFLEVFSGHLDTKCKVLSRKEVS